MNKFENPGFGEPNKETLDVKPTSKETQIPSGEQINDDEQIEQEQRKQDEKKIAEVRASLGLENKTGEEMEQKSVQDNFRNFLKLNGEMLSQTAPENDFRDYIFDKMNLSEQEKNELKKHIDSYIETNKDRGGLDLLNQASMRNYENDKQESADQAEAERQANLSPEEKMTEDVAKTNSPVELNTILQNLDNVQGSEQKFSTEEIKDLMQKLVNPNENVSVMNITRTYGLREKAIDFIEHQISNTDSIDNLRKFLNKLDNLDPSQVVELTQKLDDIESGKYVNPGSGSIDDQRSNKDQYGIIKKANEIMGLKPRKKSQPWTDLNNPPKGWDPKNP